MTPHPFPRPVIVDCDNALGVPASDVDDGLALLFLLTRPEIALRGVSTCFGNASLPLVLRATRRLLRGHDVEVLAGASGPGAPAGVQALGSGRSVGFGKPCTIRFSSSVRPRSVLAQTGTMGWK